jgi:hypothetical protein
LLALCEWGLWRGMPTKLQSIVLMWACEGTASRKNAALGSPQRIFAREPASGTKTIISGERLDGKSPLGLGCFCCLGGNGRLRGKFLAWDSWVSLVCSLVCNGNFPYIGLVKKREPIGLDFIVDKLTNSIENVITGDAFSTNVSRLTSKELRAITKANGWLFNWKSEMRDPVREVYKLTILHSPAVIHGLISLQAKSDHIYMHLLESAHFNRGKNKVYVGVPGNLVAHACMESFRRGYEGNVAFQSKTRLVAHYQETLGAFHIGKSGMIIETAGAMRLINKYYDGHYF